MDPEWTKNPHLQNEKLSPAEMAMVCDVCNPGFEMERATWDNNPEMLAMTIRANVEDSFRLYPGAYEYKWGVSKDTMLKKLWEMTPAELAGVADQVDQFWKEGPPAERQFPNVVK